MTRSVVFSVVFDGTSHYVIDNSDLQNEIDNDEFHDIKVVKSFGNINDAQDYCDDINDDCCDTLSDTHNQMFT